MRRRTPSSSQRSSSCMPNPLNRVYPNATFTIGPDVIVQERPELALQMLLVITSWATAEYQIGRLIATILGTDSRSVIEEAIRSRSAMRQRELLAQHSITKLGEEELDLLAALLIMFLSAQRARNPLVHWLSGVSPQVPRGILLANPAEYWKWHSDMETWKTTAVAGTTKTRLPALPFDRAMVYTTTDFRRILDEFNELLEAANLFDFLMIRGLPGPGQVYSRLLSLPRFAQALSRTRKGRQKAQSVP